jgi:hypothetical protein
MRCAIRLGWPGQALAARLRDGARTQTVLGCRLGLTTRDRPPGAPGHIVPSAYVSLDA